MPSGKETNITFDAIYNSSLVKESINNLFGEEIIEIIKRPDSFIIKLKKEPADIVMRIILLPPKGFTSNKIDEMLPYPEARRSKIVIKGGVRPKNRGYIQVKNAIKFAYLIDRNIRPDGTSMPYMSIDRSQKGYKEAIKNSRETFFAVTESGEGFYHNIINLSDEWLLLILEKELKSGKAFNSSSKLSGLNKNERIAIEELMKEIEKIGDNVFEKQEKLIERIVKLDPNISLPVLIEGLNMFETGNHQCCTVYAIIIKVGKKNTDITKKYLVEALKTNSAPKYYIEELIEKLKV